MSAKSYLSFRNFFLLIAVGFAVHLVLGLYAILQSERHSRIKPRYVEAVDVRGRTYHVHKDRPLDRQLQDEYERRRQMNDALRPHLVARREILEHQTAASAHSADTPTYLAVSGEGRLPTQKCGRCVLVGTAGTLLGAGSGEEIDNADCVFRLGFSPTRGFEEDVGAKSTFRITESDSFLPFLKKPLKLVSGPWQADNWFLFNVHGLEVVARLHGRLRSLTRKHKAVNFYRFSRKGEQMSLKALRNSGTTSGYKMLGIQPSSLWYALQVVDYANCSSLHVYGVPDPKICKRSEDLQLRSRYWDPFSPVLCSKGSDAGLVRPMAAPHPETLSLSDRRGMLAWALRRNVTFSIPPWPLFDKS